MLVMGLIGAVLTAAYMTRCHLPTSSSASTAGHGAHAARVGPAHHRAAHHPRRLAVVAGFVNLPDTGSAVGARRLRAALRALRRADAARTSRRPSTPRSTTPSSRSWIAVVSTAIGARSASSLAYALVLARAPARTASPSGRRLARAGYTLLVNKYYLDHLYTDVIVGGIKGPIARAAYWFNQNVIDGVVNGVGRGAGRRRPVGLQVHRPGRRRRHRQRLGRDAPRARARLLRKHADRQGAAVRRPTSSRGGHPARRHLRDRRQLSERGEDSTDDRPARRLGPHRRRSSCPWSGRR